MKQAIPKKCTRRLPNPRREGGNVIAFTAVSLVTLLGFAAFAIDGGFIHHSHAQLQHAADAAALSAIGELRNGETVATARSVSATIGEAHKAGSDPLKIDANGGDLEYGTYDFSTRTFSSGTGGSGVAAFRSFTRRTAGSASGPLGLFLGKVIGVDTSNVQAEAIAAIRRRDVMIVQDATVSFIQEFPDAIDADVDLVTSMSGAMALPGDRVGVVRFGRTATEILGLTDLASDSQLVLNALQSLQVCAAGQPGCGGTGTADAIDLAVEIFARDSVGDDAEKVLVLVTDGVPCHGEVGGGDVAWVRAGKAAADISVDDAAAAGINLFAITLAIPATGPNLCYVPDPVYNNSLARGFGIGIDTPDADDLDDILISILRQMPVRLVQ